MTKTFLSLPEYQSARNLSVYLSMPSGEVSTAAIVRDAFQNGKQVFIPYLHQADPTAASGRVSIMEMLALHSVEDYESLQPDKWGIPSLNPTTVSSRRNCFGGNGVPDPSKTQLTEANDSCLDLIVMPGLAFDENMWRLGHGKGFYDHFLMRCGVRTDGANGQRTSPRPFLGK